MSGPSFGEALGLAVLMRDHYDAIYADFRRDYNLDLEEFIQGGATANQVAALINGLHPTESALYRSVNPEDYWWTNELEMLATLIEASDRHNRHFVEAYSEDHKSWAPVRIERPGVKAKTESRPGMTMKELMAITPPSHVKVVKKT